MFFIYNLGVWMVQQIIQWIALFHPKMKLFVEGRRSTFTILGQKIKFDDHTFWFHAASLGEYEQGIPVMEAIKKKCPNHSIVLTFFSPSGYEVCKNTSVADVIVYLPLDTRKNVKKFIKAVHPEKVFFIKYEYWPNYLDELNKRNIPTYLISGIFRENQLFFKWYGDFYRKALNAFTYFFVQNEASKTLLEKLGKTNVIISGDTRFDRVLRITERDNTLSFISEFKDDKTTIGVGSSWEKDEQLLINIINTSYQEVKWIIAPHNIKIEQIMQLRQSILKKVVLFSEREGKKLSDFDVFIIDTMGLLTKIYSYVDIAYVGGGFNKSGVHNILEPAVFGIPVIIGPYFDRFAEATELVNRNGCISINTQEKLNIIFNMFIRDKDLREEKGLICKNFVQENKNATTIILNHIFIDI